MSAIRMMASVNNNVSINQGWEVGRSSLRRKEPHEGKGGGMGRAKGMEFYSSALSLSLDELRLKAGSFSCNRRFLEAVSWQKGKKWLHL